ncbi:hypothetical protein MMC18_009630 [Xylographa bjoerkii]|nr:hypothetical protein [Xylographa bjoerkii]
MPRKAKAKPKTQPAAKIKLIDLSQKDIKALQQQVKSMIKKDRVPQGGKLRILHEKSTSYVIGETIKYLHPCMRFGLMSPVLNVEINKPSAYFEKYKTVSGKPVYLTIQDRNEASLPASFDWTTEKPGRITDPNKHFCDAFGSIVSKTHIWFTPGLTNSANRLRVASDMATKHRDWKIAAHKQYKTDCKRYIKARKSWEWDLSDSVQWPTTLDWDEIEDLAGPRDGEFEDSTEDPRTLVEAEDAAFNLINPEEFVDPVDPPVSNKRGNVHFCALLRALCEEEDHSILENMQVGPYQAYVDALRRGEDPVLPSADTYEAVREDQDLTTAIVVLELKSTLKHLAKMAIIAGTGWDIDEIDPVVWSRLADKGPLPQDPQIAANTTPIPQASPLPALPAKVQFTLDIDRSTLSPNRFTSVNQAATSTVNSAIFRNRYDKDMKGIKGGKIEKTFKEILNDKSTAYFKNQEMERQRQQKATNRADKVREEATLSKARRIAALNKTRKTAAIPGKILA